jgi:hypothetical protein
VTIVVKQEFVAQIVALVQGAASKMSAKQTKGRNSKTGRIKKGAKGGYFGNSNAKKKGTKKRKKK